MPDEGENIRLHILDYQDIDPLFQQNRLCNAPVIMALQWLRQHVVTIIKN
jgi:ADP-ribose pyrophosphatase